MHGRRGGVLRAKEEADAPSPLLSREPDAGLIQDLGR